MNIVNMYKEQYKKRFTFLEDCTNKYSWCAFMEDPEEKAFYHKKYRQASWLKDDLYKRIEEKEIQFREEHKAEIIAIANDYLERLGYDRAVRVLRNYFEEDFTFEEYYKNIFALHYLLEQRRKTEVFNVPTKVEMQNQQEHKERLKRLKRNKDI